MSLVLGVFVTTGVGVGASLTDIPYTEIIGAATVAFVAAVVALARYRNGWGYRDGAGVLAALAAAVRSEWTAELARSGQDDGGLCPFRWRYAVPMRVVLETVDLSEIGDIFQRVMPGVG